MRRPLTLPVFGLSTCEDYLPCCRNFSTILSVGSVSLLHLITPAVFHTLVLACIHLLQNFLENCLTLLEDSRNCFWCKGGRSGTASKTARVHVGEWCEIYRLFWFYLSCWSWSEELKSRVLTTGLFSLRLRWDRLQVNILRLYFFTFLLLYFSHPLLAQLLRGIILASYHVTIAPHPM